jgi:hypothetical protein
LLDAAAKVLPWFGRARAGEDLRHNPAANAARAAYNAAISQMSAEGQRREGADLALEAVDHVHAIIAGASADPGPALAALAEYGDALRAAQLRTAEMIGHALDAGQAQALVDSLEALCVGAQVQFRPLSQAEGLLGWGLEMVSAAPSPRLD